VAGYFSLFVISVFFLFTIASFRKSVIDQSERYHGSRGQVLKEHFASLLTHEDIVLPMAALLSAAIIAWILGHPVIALVFLNSLVIIFALQATYHFVAKLRPDWLRKSRELEIIVIILPIVAIGIAASFSLPYYVIYGVFISFYAILFISGLGAIEVINSAVSWITNKVWFCKRWQISLLFGMLGLLYLTLRYSISTLGAIESAGSVSFDPQGAWLAGLGFMLLGVVSAIFAGSGYFFYLVIRNKEATSASSLFYGTIMICISGCFIGFVFGSLGFASFNQDFSHLSLAEYLSSFVAPMTLFTIGYVQILFEVPRNLASKLGVEEKKFAAAFAFFLLFSAVAVYESWAIFGSISGYLAEQSYIPYYGMLFGGVFLAIRKNRGHPARLAAVLSGMALIVSISIIFIFYVPTFNISSEIEADVGVMIIAPILLEVRRGSKRSKALNAAKPSGKLARAFCSHCGARLSGDETYCGNCGSRVKLEPAS
jgi:hypothetical protein